MQTIAVAGGCEGVTLTAHRNGSVITLTPKIEETGAPWGFEYLQEYADYYHCYAPKDYINDREFMVRTGLNAEDATEDHEKYLQNLNYLMSLGLLRLYSGNISLSAVGSVDLSTMSDTESDLYILSHVIAAEAGPNKLDELMVGCVFVNRVASSLFPNTFKGVLTSGAYACYSDGNYQEANPTDSEIASAIQVLTGQFAIPDNIFGQSASIQGAIYKTVVNGAGLNTHYYCAMPAGVAVSTVDRFGRPAPGAEQLDVLAEALSGATSTQAGASAASINYASTAFIGDSLMDGLDITHDLSGKGAVVITESYATIAHMTDLINASGSLHEGISTVYMLIGTQSSTLNDSDFRAQYAQLLTAVRAKSPYANIILIALPPVVDGISTYSNIYINQKNSIISDIGASNGYSLIDINTPLLDGGQLSSAYSADGTNLTAAAYDILFSKIQSGLTSSSVGTDVSDAYSFYDQNGIPIYSRYTLYDISEYDVITATNMQARVVQAETGIVATLKALLGGVVDFVTDTLEGFVDFFSQFLYATQEAITGRNLDRSEDVCYRYGAPYNGYDVKSVVYHSIAFSTQTWFSTAQSAADEMAESEKGLMFLFVGKSSALGLGTISGSGMMTAVPGVGASVSGMISPTATYYPPLQSYNPSTGYEEISTPLGTQVLAAADGSIVEVGTDDSDARGRYVIQEASLEGKTYTITYGYLQTVSVSAGSSVSNGSLIGTSGKKQDGTAAMYLSVSVDGAKVDPNSIFYQSSYVYGGGSLGQDLYNADGSVNKAKIQALSNELKAMIASGSDDMYHKPPLNALQRLQCTWWAYGRGLNYLQASGSPVAVSDYNKLRGNGGEYARNNELYGVFNFGDLPKPNSLVCFPGSPYGHVAYVEAVDYVNKKYYVSEAGSGVAFYGVIERDFNYVMAKYGTKGIFIYLDEPR